MFKRLVLPPLLFALLVVATPARAGVIVITLTGTLQYPNRPDSPLDLTGVSVSFRGVLDTQAAPLYNLLSNDETVRVTAYPTGQLLTLTNAGALNGSYSPDPACAGFYLAGSLLESDGVTYTDPIWNDQFYWFGVYQLGDRQVYFQQTIYMPVGYHGGHAGSDDPLQISVLDPGDVIYKDGDVVYDQFADTYHFNELFTGLEVETRSPAVPEPASFLLLCSGLIGAGLTALRRRR